MAAIKASAGPKNNVLFCSRCQHLLPDSEIQDISNVFSGRRKFRVRCHSLELEREFDSGFLEVLDIYDPAHKAECNVANWLQTNGQPQPTPVQPSDPEQLSLRKGLAAVDRANVRWCYGANNRPVDLRERQFLAGVVGGAALDSIQVDGNTYWWDAEVAQYTSMKHTAAPVVPAGVPKTATKKPAPTIPGEPTANHGLYSVYRPGFTKETKVYDDLGQFRPNVRLNGKVWRWRVSTEKYEQDAPVLATPKPPQHTPDPTTGLTPAAADSLQQHVNQMVERRRNGGPLEAAIVTLAKEGKLTEAVLKELQIGPGGIDLRKRLYNAQQHPMDLLLLDGKTFAWNHSRSVYEKAEMYAPPGSGPDVDLTVRENLPTPPATTSFPASTRRKITLED